MDNFLLSGGPVVCWRMRGCCTCWYSKEFLHAEEPCYLSALLRRLSGGDVAAAVRRPLGS